MADLSKITTPDGTDYDIVSKTGRGLVRATMDTSSTATAFVVAADGITSLYDGLTIIVKNTIIASASGCTLNLNNLGAKRIRLSQNNSWCTTHWGKNSENIFIYDATNSWWTFQQGYDTNTNTQVRAYRQTYANDYPILASRTLGSSIGTPGTESSQTAIYAMIPDDATKQPTINPSTGELKAKIIDATSVNGHTVGKDVPSNAVFTDTHRVIKVNGTQALASNTTALNLQSDQTYGTCTVTNKGSGNIEFTATGDHNVNFLNLDSGDAMPILLAPSGRDVSGNPDPSAVAYNDNFYYDVDNEKMVVNNIKTINSDAYYYAGQLEIWQENWDNDNQKRAYIWGARMNSGSTTHDRKEVRIFHQIYYNVPIKLNTVWGYSYYHSNLLYVPLPTCEECFGVNITCQANNKFVVATITGINTTTNPRIGFWLWGPKQESTEFNCTIHVSGYIRYSTSCH